jgi:HlyD family secretion protein
MNTEGYMKKVVIILLLVVVAGGAGGYWYWEAQNNSRPVLRYEEVGRGKLVATIGSTGTVQAQDVVDVGAQVAGRIIFIGKDSNTQSGIVDWGSDVQGPVFDKDGKMTQPGTVLAQIDPSLYAAQVRATDAAVKAANADKLQKQANLNQATREWQRADKLFSEQGIAQAEYDQFLANLEVAKANFEVSVANIGVAEANSQNAKTNLEYATISAPVTGVVIDRRVNVGQTVVASLSAPSLFLIAKDLSKMEIWATVNEVDVSKIQVGQKVNFTVDSYPGRVYHGQVVPQGRLPFRLNATMNQNVVTYTVVVSVNNEDRALRPYMTANLTFIVAERENALLVPNAALRWQPSRQQIAPDMRDSYAQLRSKKRGPNEAEDRGVVWVRGDDDLVRYVEVKLGYSDSVKTEVLGTISGELSEHTPIVVGETKAGSRAGSSNPFAPQMFRTKPKEQS